MKTKQTFVCSLEGCKKEANPKWDFHDSHFCGEKHLIEWVNKSLHQSQTIYKPHHD